MEPLGRLLSTDSRETLQFFFSELRDVSQPEHPDEKTILYNASLLAHFASTSTATGAGLPTPASLVEVFDRFVLRAPLRDDPGMMEMAGGQCLLFSGFFADQLDDRHNLAWYGKLGAGFYRVAAATSQMPGHRQMMARMARDFEFWRRQHRALAKMLRDQPYYLRQG